jgi:hypothetical protein
MAILGIALTGCDVSPAATGAFDGAVRDSAGIRIVEHSSIPADLLIWEVADPPVLRIGALDGTGPDVFGRVSGVAELSDGTLVVADAQAMELRAFDGSGAHLWSAGRSGGGPGEFTGSIVRLLQLAGDTLIATDSGRRAHLFSGAGDFARTLVFDPQREGATPPAVIGALPEGTLLTTGPPATAPAGGAPVGGYQRQTVVLGIGDRLGATHRELGTFRGTESHIETQPGPGGVIAGITIMTMHMGRNTVFAAGGSSIVIGTQDRFELLRYDPSGELASVIRVTTPPVVVTGAIRERALAQAPNRPLPDTLPAFGAILIDSGERLWVEEFVPTYEAERIPRWWVFNPEGSLIAAVTVPERFTPRTVGEETVIGVRLDEFDVAYVERRRIVRR